MTIRNRFFTVALAAATLSVSALAQEQQPTSSSEPSTEQAASEPEVNFRAMTRAEIACNNNRFNIYRELVTQIAHTREYASAYEQADALIANFVQQIRSDSSEKATRARTLLRQHGDAVRDSRSLSAEELNELETSLNELAASYGLLVPANQIVCPTTHPVVIESQVAALASESLSTPVCGASANAPVDQLVPATHVARLHIAYDTIKDANGNMTQLDFIEEGAPARLIMSATVQEVVRVGTFRFRREDVRVHAPVISASSYADPFVYPARHVVSDSIILPQGGSANGLPLGQYAESFLTPSCQTTLANLKAEMEQAEHGAHGPTSPLVVAVTAQPASAPIPAASESVHSAPAPSAPASSGSVTVTTSAVTTYDSGSSFYGGEFTIPTARVMTYEEVYGGRQDHVYIGDRDVPLTGSYSGSSGRASRDHSRRGQEACRGRVIYRPGMPPVYIGGRCTARVSNSARGNSVTQPGISVSRPRPSTVRTTTRQTTQRRVIGNGSAARRAH